jgi:hypothetical protein
VSHGERHGEQRRGDPETSQCQRPRHDGYAIRERRGGQVEGGALAK